jgi:hypothetical protein
MIKEALEFLTKLQTPKNPLTVEIHGEPYGVKVDGTVGDYIKIPRTTVIASRLEVVTLSALVAAYKAGIDSLDGALVAVHVVDPFEVEVIDINADAFGDRHSYIRASHETETPFPFDTFLKPEEFLIKFRASFFFNDEATKVQQLCSTLEVGTTVNVADDGISQQVTAVSGTITKAAIKLPAEGIPLIPWRTFRDANPVESKFLLRMKGVKDSLPMIALFEIDEKWKLDTVGAIRDYLAENLPDATIIA